jgi:hypothetical protein
VPDPLELEGPEAVPEELVSSAAAAEAMIAAPSTSWLP